MKKNIIISSISFLLGAVIFSFITAYATGVCTVSISAVGNNAGFASGGAVLDGYYFK